MLGMAKGTLKRHLGIGAVLCTTTTRVRGFGDSPKLLNLTTACGEKKSLTQQSAATLHLTTEGGSDRGSGGMYVPGEAKGTEQLPGSAWRLTLSFRKNLRSTS
eukprot:Hpha_TRINITY_DN16230_c2_g1::TRINITY_DN16230_c2_g1_i10::g.11486::m.11486